ncbi:SAM-dependent methyltransferase [Pseudonocardiaceae bacterium YIM PH 21723]|nr:SAM-dependent methyltransferase [Pseudonocardiaceae bacterium YIM PH 21723]
MNHRSAPACRGGGRVQGCTQDGRSSTATRISRCSRRSGGNTGCMTDIAKQPSGVGLTAIAVAYGRLVEAQRPNPLFEDRFAGIFLSELGEVRELQRVRPEPGSPQDRVARTGLDQVSARTRYFDDLLLEAAETCPQVVILASGLDARAFRLEFPAGTRLFEIDLPDMLEFKESVVAKHGLKPTCARTALTVDLRTDFLPELVRHGFGPATPTVWLAEGLLMYFTQQENDELIERIGIASAPGSRLAILHASEEALRRRRESIEQAGLTNSFMGSMARDMWKSGLRTDPVDWLTPFGWTVTSIPAADQAAVYGRPVDAGDDFQRSAWFIDATR